MKSGKKALLLALCAVLLVAATVMGTMAYLTATDKVENTFTIGNIAIKLDEAPVDADGKKTEGNRVQANTYKLMPGHEYDKDPIVHVAANSEDSWIFVKVENGIAAFEDSNSTIADQISQNLWAPLSGVPGVYYKQYNKETTAVDLAVFEGFKIADDANNVTGWSNISATTTKVTVTAYAVQADGFANANAAWNATFGAQTSGN